MDLFLALALAATPAQLPHVADSLAWVRGTGRRQIMRDVWLTPPPLPTQNQWTA